MSVITKGLTKTYNKGTTTAFNDIDLTISDGELFGVIGPDGAGKTSLFRVLTTLLLADAGSASVCGFDVVKDYKEIRKISGYMPGKFSLYQDLSVQENIDFFATIFETTFQKNRHSIEEIYTQLEPFKDRPAGKLSGGMKQKLALCCALIHEPKILFLDEPTTGVDPVSRKEFWDMLHRLKQRGITIIVSTPYMDEASKCDRIALMQNGRILTVDTLDHILASFKETIYAVKTEQIYKVTNILRASHHVKSAFSFGEELHVTLNGNANEVNIEDILKSFDLVASVTRTTPTIEDVFMAMDN
jgi:ABC-2 type transport system ATP-binding protein